MTASTKTGSAPHRSDTGEAAFEAHIAGWLVDHGGYRRVKVGNAAGKSDFDDVAGLDTVDLFEFIGATQPGEWVRLVDAGYGGDEVPARAGFVQRLASQLDKRGTVDMLRHGVVDRNVRLRLAFFKPGSGLAPELMARHDANILSVTRQLRHEPSSNRTVDLGLFVNGVAVATAELKNPLTGQGVEQAMVQYRKDRDPKNRTLGRVGMVHFAVDPYPVWMTPLASLASRPGSYRSTRATISGRATRPILTSMRRPTCGSGCGPVMRGWTSWAGSSMSRSRPRGPRLVRR